MSTLGRTFLAMLLRPVRGIHHVIDLFEEHARTYLGIILPDIAQDDSWIDHARVGYILKERWTRQSTPGPRVQSAAARPIGRVRAGLLQTLAPFTLCLAWECGQLDR